MMMILQNNFDKFSSSFFQQNPFLRPGPQQRPPLPKTIPLRQPQQQPQPQQRNANGNQNSYNKVLL